MASNTRPEPPLVRMACKYLESAAETLVPNLPHGMCLNEPPRIEASALVDEAKGDAPRRCLRQK